MSSSDLAPDGSVLGVSNFIMGLVNINSLLSCIPLGSFFVVDALNVDQSLAVFLAAFISSVTGE